MSDPARIRVLVVEDHLVSREGLAAIVGADPGMEVVGLAADGRAGLEAFLRLRPDVTLVDLGLPVLSGLDAIKAMRAQVPDARIVVLTAHDGDEDIYRALQAGALSYLLKDAGREELLQAVRLAARGRRHLPSEVAERLADRVGGNELTHREQDVLALIVEGRSNREIGQALGITEATVKAHMNSILGKLGVKQRTEAAAVAVRRGLVRPPAGPAPGASNQSRTRS
jgi:DNA-binding NarL/FixJ family response regulator